MPAKLTWPTLTTLHRNILKCAVAYFLGSLFTFVPALSDVITNIGAHGEGEERRPSIQAHMVATVAVYFNPAKTAGAMVEADLYCLLGLAWASFLCLVGMSTFWEIDTIPGWEWLADALVIVWIGLGMTVVAWLKVRLGKPTFNAAASMTAIIVFIVVVKEGGVQTLMQVAFIVVLGAIVTNFVCLTIWPQSAAANLRGNLRKTLDSFGVVLGLVTRGFLGEDDDAQGDSTPIGKPQPSQAALQRAVEAHQASFTSLKRSLDEAQMEWLGGGPSLAVPTFGGRGELRIERAATAYEDAVDCMNRLAQHLNGLRSGAGLQHELAELGRSTREMQTYPSEASHAPSHRATLAGRMSPRSGEDSSDGSGTGSPVKRKSVDTSVSVGVSPVSREDYSSEDSSGKCRSEESDMRAAASAAFDELLEELHSPLNALSTTCINALERLRDAFSGDSVMPSSRTQDGCRIPIESHEFVELAEGIERALFTFESTSNHAVMRVYRRSHAFASAAGSRRHSFHIDDADEDLDAAPMENESVLLVYFFIFTLQEFAKELTALIDAISRIYTIERTATAGGILHRWRMFSIRFKEWRKRAFNRSESDDQVTPLTRRPERKNPPSLKRRISSFLSPQTPRQKAVFPKVKPHAPNTIQTPARAELSFSGRVKQSIWALSARMKEPTVKYAIKAGMATAVLAAPAFIDATRPVFVDFRGEWALISFFVVISPTIGATNFLSLHRILGTLTGATVAICAFSLLHDNPVALTIFGFFYSIPCFYVIVATPQYGTSGRFFLLTYNLTCLYCYNTRDLEVSVVGVAFRRATSVTVGVLWAAFVARFWWPAEARRELGNALSEFCLNIGWLYTHLVAANSGIPVRVAAVESRGPYELVGEHPRSDEHERESTSLLPSDATVELSNSIRTFMAMELHLQIKLIELRSLLAQTAHEPRLKGPFPIKTYQSILASLQTILDKLHSMRCVTTREEWFTMVRREFILPVNRERREMVGNIMLYFSVLSSAFKLKAPLPPYLPPAEQSRQRLVEAIRRLDVMRSHNVKGSRQLLYFAYALTMKGVTHELDYLGRTLQQMFGVIGQTAEEFEELFGTADQV